MNSYYGEKLHGHRLKHCYALAPPRVKQYLDAEIQFVLERISPYCRVLELGCGYGRVLQHLTNRRRMVFGIDIAQANAELAQRISLEYPKCHVFVMDATFMGFKDSAFDCVICVQNGIAAFNVDPKQLISESVRVTKDRGLIILSSYSSKIWPERLQWFRLQAEAGLLGEIDWHRTRSGTIVCKDGFTATTVDPGMFRELVVDFPVDVSIEEVDGSSICCVLTVHKNNQAHAVP
jgi:SAM-dependent methyltransferase